MGLKLQEAKKKIEDKEMMTEGLGAIISEKKKDPEASGEKKNYIGDLENKSGLRSQLGVASCGDEVQQSQFFISKWMMKMFQISSCDSRLHMRNCKLYLQEYMSRSPGTMLHLPQP